MARPDRLLQAVTLAVRLRSPTLQRLLQMLRRPQPGWMGKGWGQREVCIGALDPTQHAESPTGGHRKMFQNCPPSQFGFNV
jgi:hypothetical protein